MLKVKLPSIVTSKLLTEKLAKSQPKENVRLRWLKKLISSSCKIHKFLQLKLSH